MDSTVHTDDLTDNEKAPTKDQAIEATLRSLRTLLLSDQDEQQATLEYLKNAVDEDRSSERGLFQSK